MGEKLNTGERTIKPSLEEVAVKVKIANDLVQCLWLASHSFDDDGERCALMRVSDFALLNLIDALNVIEILMKEGGK